MTRAAAGTPLAEFEETVAEAREALRDPAKNPEPVCHLALAQAVALLAIVIDRLR